MCSSVDRAFDFQSKRRGFDPHHTLHFRVHFPTKASVLINMNKYICKYCGRSDFKSPKSYGGHLTNCSLNPSKQISIDKSSKSRTIKRIEFQKICKKCGKQFIIFCTQNQLKKSPSYCSSKCSHSRSLSKKSRLKISKRLSDRFKESGAWGGRSRFLGYEDVSCKVCAKSFTKKVSVKKSTCSKECLRILISRKVSGKTGGPRRRGGTGKHSDYISKSGSIFHCQSTMELKMCEILDNLNLKWKRNLNGFPYVTLDGKKRKYYPDFYIETFDIFLETKGYVNDEVIHKMTASNIPNLMIVKTNKYGGNWDEIILDNNVLLNQFKQFNK